MKSISKLISNLLNESLRLTYPFPEKALIYKNDINPDYDYYSDISLILFGKYKDKMLKLWGASNTPPTPQSYSEEILINLSRKHDFLHKISHDFDGKILFKLDNSFIESSIKELLRKEGNPESGIKDINNMTQVGILYPFGEMAQKIHLNQMRGINISETMARIHEFLGFKVQRFSCLQNSSHFHGIVLAYLLEKELGEDLEFNEKDVKFENLSKFLLKKAFKSNEEIMNYGAEMLLELQNNDKAFKLFDKLNNVALQDMVKNYNAFIAGKEQLTIIDTLNLNKKMEKFIKDLSAKGKVFFSEKDGYYIKIKDNKIITLMDPYNLLTKEGIFLGFLYEISSLHFIDKAVFSTDLQDIVFYENIQEGYEVLFGERRMHINMEFLGHNSLFVKNPENPNKKLQIYLDQFLNEIIDEGIKKSMMISKAFPSNLTEENRKIMQKMVLGWVRYLDLKHKKEESYVLDLDEWLNFIFSDDIVNVRLYLSEKLKDFKDNEQEINNFKLETAEQRAFSIKLLEFLDILEKVVEERNIKVLTDYLEVLIKMVKYYEKENKNLCLTKAGYLIITKSFHILGII